MDHSPRCFVNCIHFLFPTLEIKNRAMMANLLALSVLQTGNCCMCAMRSLPQAESVLTMDPTGRSLAWESGWGERAD